MKEISRISIPPRGGALFLAVASAAIVTGDLIDIPRLKCPFWMGCVFGAAAWLMVAVAWRRFRAQPQPVLKFPLSWVAFGLIGEFIIVSVAYRSLFPSPAEQQYRAMMTAIDTGDMTTLQGVLARGADPDFVPGCHDATSEDMLGYGCGDSRLLVIAVKKGDVEIAKALIERDASVFVEYQNLAAIASDTGNSRMMRMLIEHKAPIDDEFDGCRPLWDAVERERTSDVAFLVAHNANVYDKHDSVTLLHFAQSKKNAAIVKMLKQAGAKE